VDVGFGGELFAMGVVYYERIRSVNEIFRSCAPETLRVNANPIAKLSLYEQRINAGSYRL
jgi:hypothetical protein